MHAGNLSQINVNKLIITASSNAFAFNICDVICENLPYGGTNSVLLNKLFVHVRDNIYYWNCTVGDKNVRCRCSLATNTIGPDQTQRSVWLLFISYRLVKGFLAIISLLLVFSSWNFQDVCQHFYITRNEISAGSDKKWEMFLLGKPLSLVRSSYIFVRGYIKMLTHILKVSARNNK